MSCGSDRPARQRFKGIENFLRRVAFNLGNTPSQTEVKIISCIPIDVTDLQQKINALEKELSEVREAANFNETLLCEAKNVKINPNPTRAYTSIVQTALGRTNPTFSKPKVATQCKCSQAKTSVTNHAVNTKLEKGKSSRVNRFKRKLSSLCIVSSFSTSNKDKSGSKSEREIPIPTKKCCSKIVPKRLRRAMRKNKGKTHMIYFTDASRTPFNNYKMSESIDNKTALNRNVISRSYINNVIRKQYESELMVDDITDISQFSTPACKDSDNESRGFQIPHNYESFKNHDITNSTSYESSSIDMNNVLSIDRRPIVTEYKLNKGINYSGYYDSNYYDIYPVKEKSMKHKREETPPKQIKRLGSDDFSEPIRIMNNLRPIAFDESVSKKQYKHQSCKINDGHGHEYALTNVTKKKNRNNEYTKVSLNESKLCSIEYGNIYLKRNRAIEGMEKIKPITPTFKNAECLTLNTNNMECQTVESKGVQLNIHEDNKAELALDQIKIILQSVLAEVKTNMRSNNTVNKEKRSVHIQKDISHKNVRGGSTLLNSFTYYNPPCSINPCLTSYSRHLPDFCYPNFSGMPMKCFQHYPLLVPPIKHFGCNCHHKSKLPADKCKKATNSETEAQMAQKSETMNLIQEIYKSVPLNVYYSNKTTSKNSFPYQKNNINAEVESLKSRKLSLTEHSIVEDINEFDEPATTPTSYATNDNTDTILESIQSEISSGTIDHVDTKQSPSTTNHESVRSSIQKVSQTSISFTEEKFNNIIETAENEMAEQDETKDEHVLSNMSESETDSDGTLVADETTHKKEKPGLLKIMLQTVKKLKRKKITWQKSNPKGGIENDSASVDSESDSQTVYSYKTFRNLKASAPTNPKQTKSTVQTTRDVSRPIQDYKRVSPYMEQEYRRYWDEKLMFHDTKPKQHSSERSFPSWTRSPHTPIYWRNFEARSAVLRDEHLKLQQGNGKEFSEMKGKPCPILHKEKTGLKLEWMKKQKNKTANK